MYLYVGGRRRNRCKSRKYLGPTTAVPAALLEEEGGGVYDDSTGGGSAG